MNKKIISNVELTPEETEALNIGLGRRAIYKGQMLTVSESFPDSFVKRTLETNLQAKRERKSKHRENIRKNVLKNNPPRNDTTE